MKTKLLRVFLILMALVLAIGSVELYLRIFGKDRFDIKTSLSRQSQRPKELRLQLEKNKHEKFDFVHDGKLIYRQEVETDEWGRRKSYEPYFSKVLVLFFGCSYTYGSGLQQQETLPYQFSKATQIDSANYALPAYGPHGMLRQLELLPLQEQTPSSYSSVYATYVFYGFQWRRATGGAAWIAKMGGGHPFYKLDPVSKKVSYQGVFAEVQPVKMWLVRLFSQFHLMHYLPQLWGDEKVTEEDQLLFCGMVNKSGELLREKLGSRFKGLKIIHPLFEHDKSWSEFLSGAKKCFDSQVELIEFKIPGSREEWAIDSVLEDHPNAKFNELLSQFLAQEWQELEKK
jgi:hypothetical protein